MASVGKVLRIPDRQQDAVTAISGSGPAYILFVVESMIEAGVHLGLPRTTAPGWSSRPWSARPICARDRYTPDRAARAGDLAGRDHGVGAARAGGAQGARRVPRRDGGRARPVPAARRGRLNLSPRRTTASSPRQTGGMDARLPMVWGATPEEAGGTTRPTTWCPTRCCSPAPSPCRPPPEADLAVAVPGRGGAVLLRLDRQPRPPIGPRC